VSWRDRLRQVITLVSPQGNTFGALWRGDPRSKEKSLGRFKYPGVRGEKTQDLEIGAVRYPLTIYFQGENHDLEGERFWQACDESGPWAVTHPVKGDVALQLVSISERVDPVESGNITQFNTEWVEPLGVTVVVSAAQLQAQITSGIVEVNTAGAEQLETNIIQKSASAVAKFQAAVESIQSTVKSTLAPLYEVSSEINSQISAVQRGIDDTLSIIPIDVLSIAGQIQNLIQLPALAITDIEARIEAYENMAAAIFADEQTESGAAVRNGVAVNELALTAIIGAVADSVVTGELENRVQAISIIESNIGLFDDITNYLDDAQALYLSDEIENQYFSQGSSFSVAYNSIGLTVAYLLRSSFDLSIEKRFRLLKNRAPIEITITEYGDVEEFDFFIDTNQLSGDDILVLPAGREVVVYI